MTILRIKRGRKGPGKKGGFSLVELLVATTILVIIVLVLLQMTLSMTKLWQTTSGTVSDFQAARLAFTTINRDLARATLHTYYDYYDTTSAAYGSPNAPFGVVRTYDGTATISASNNTSVFTPVVANGTVPVIRSSELHFVTGPAATLLGQSGYPNNFPGSAVFFQAPLGYTLTSNNKPLNQALNSVGYFVQYNTPVNLPGWLSTLFGATGTAPKWRFQLIKAIQPTENFDLYTMTTVGAYNLLHWLPNTTLASPIGAASTTSTEAAASYTTSVLAENVLLLVFRPRLDPNDEQTAAPLLNETYSSTTENSIISPAYTYDSRAWETGYVSTAVSRGTTSVNGNVKYSFASLTRNQLPSIVDVAMICADDASMGRLPVPSAGVPPLKVQVPNTLFTNSADLDADLATYEAQLSAAPTGAMPGAPIRFRVFRSSVNMQSSAWINNN